MKRVLYEKDVLWSGSGPPSRIHSLEDKVYLRVKRAGGYFL